MTRFLKDFFLLICLAAGLGAAAQTESLYVRLELDLDSAGQTLVGEARVIAGEVIAADRIAGDYLYEVTYRGESVMLGTFEAGMEARGFAEDGSLIEEHSNVPLEETTVQVRFPVGAWYGIESATDLLQVGLYRINHGPADPTLLSPARIAAADPDALSLVYQSPYGALTDSLVTAKRNRDNDPAADAHLDWEPGLTYKTPKAAATVTPLLLTGSTGTKKNLVIIGDGFAAGDQVAYNNLVENLVMTGAFGQDVFYETKNAFNIYRINAVSAESGVSNGVHCIWESEKVANPTQNNLKKGTFSIAMNAGGGALHYITAGATSLQKVADEFKAFSVVRTDACGDDKVNTFKVRMIESTEDLDGDGVDEPVGRLRVFAPRNLIGPVGNFTITINQNGAFGNDLVFNKVQDGALDLHDTAMDYIHNGLWDHCWLQSSCTTKAKRDALMALVPDATYGIIILNTNGAGGCGGGGYQHFTKSSSVGTVIHEMGHGIGGLGDEYSQSRTYTGNNEPGAPNLTLETDAGLVKWADFIRPGTPTPTVAADGLHPNDEVGIYEGGNTYSKGVFRPSHTCRMRSSGSSHYCPVCYHHIRALLYPFQELSFQKSYAGDFNGDGKDDIIIHSAESLELHLSDGDRLTEAWRACSELDGWKIRAYNTVAVGDFNGDGMDDLLLRTNTWIGGGSMAVALSDGAGFAVSFIHQGSLGGWTFKLGDKVFVGDFDGDGADDLYIYNGTSWANPRLSMFHSLGDSFDEVATFDQFINGWFLADDAHIQIGDLDGDGLADIFSHSPSAGRMRMWRSTGMDLQYVRSYWGNYHTDPGITAGTIHAGDEYHVADFNNDGKDDLYLFNTTEEVQGRLVMLRSDGSFLITTRNYNGAMTGWDFKAGDRLVTADIDGDHRRDLYFYNGNTPGAETIGMARSNGTGLDAANKHVNWIDGWNIGPTDELVAGNFSGGAGWEDLFVHNSSWFGLMRSKRTSLTMDRLYHYYLHNFQYYAPLGHDN